MAEMIIFACMKAIAKLLLIMGIALVGSAALTAAPKGKLIYCSYSRTGVAGLGKDYCELIADTDSIPKVVVVLNQGSHFDPDEIRETYVVDTSVVDSLQAGLAEREIYKLDGYKVDEQMAGGHIYRIYMEYDSGEKVNARWYGHDIKPEALSAYAYIERFFAPWRQKARKQ